MTRVKGGFNTSEYGENCWWYGLYVEVLMDLDKQIKLGHLLLNDRKCRVCGETKNLIESFYRTRKDRGAVCIIIFL